MKKLAISMITLSLKLFSHKTFTFANVLDTNMQPHRRKRERRHLLRDGELLLYFFQKVFLLGRTRS